MGFGSVLGSTRAFSRSWTNSYKEATSILLDIFTFMIYGGPVTLQLISNNFPLSAGPFFPHQFGGCGATIFRHCIRIAAFWPDHPSACQLEILCWHSGVWDPDTSLYRIIGLRLFSFFLLSSTLCIFGSFFICLFHFSKKKGYRHASGFGFLRKFVRMG